MNFKKTIILLVLFCSFEISYAIGISSRGSCCFSRSYSYSRPIYTRTVYVNRGNSMGDTIATSMTTAFLINALSKNADEGMKLDIATCESMKDKDDIHNCLVNLQTKNDNNDGVIEFIIIAFLVVITFLIVAMLTC